jgi:DNA (cytosine-5)-methyltransferase 1
VDLVTAGFPCQPFSQAGRRRGLDDERWLWPDIARVVREVGADFAFLENVRGFVAVHGGLGAVLADLADLGFDAEWTVLPAAGLGSPHRRERFWLLYLDRPDELGTERVAVTLTRLRERPGRESS